MRGLSIRELLARIKALLRRSQGYENILTVGHLQLNETAHTLHINQELVNIGYTEFNLLKFLDKMLQTVRGIGYRFSADLKNHYV